MNKFLPDMYQKDIFSINYDKLKDNGIKVLLFDFDNTIMEKGAFIPDDKLISFFKDLNKKFEVIILSNTLKKKKISNFCCKCGLKFMMRAMKPFSFGYKKVIKKRDKKIFATIGDQLVTDVYGSKRLGLYTVLVDPVGLDDMKLTKINRKMENILFKKLNKKFKFVKGEYYD